MSDKVHDIVTEKIIAALEQGVVPWHKPWKAETGRPMSMSTRKPYNGINIWLLALTAAERGYQSPWWGTYKQIEQLGGQVRKGEKSTLVVWWKILVKDETDPATGKVTTNRIPMLRYFLVFNAEQADGLPERFYPAPGERIVPDPIGAAEDVFGKYIANGGPTLQYVRGDRACYNRTDDVLTMPERDQFPTIAAFYSTAFHEAGHSTGHKSRLDRADLYESQGIAHAGAPYSREELTAEITAVLLMAETGVDSDYEFDQSASYVAGWLRAFKDEDNRRLIVTAAGRADKAASYILGAGIEAEMDDEVDLDDVAA